MEDKKEIKENNTNIISSFIWRFLERCGAQGVTLIVSIVLARLLDPKVYGTVALVTIFTTIMQIFVDSGMGSSLIQKKDADDLDFSSVFYFNVCMCSVLYMIMFFAAPFIASLYKMPELTSVIRVLSLILVISGVKNVQQAYVSRHLMFKKFFFATLGGTIGAAIVGILMAYLGYGVWALVAQMLFNAIVDTIILWITVKWRPKKMFSFSRLKGLFSFGWKLLVSALLDTIYNNLRQLIIGKVYTKQDLAYYNNGKKYPEYLVSNINTAIDSVLLPTMSNEQDHPERVKSMTRRAIKTATFIIMPLMVGFAVCAKPIVSLILTDKWLPAVPYMQIFCVSFAFYPIHTANLNAMKAMGRSDLFLILEIIKKAIGLVTIVIALKFGVMAMAYSMLITSFISQVVNAWPNKKLLGYSYLEQVKDMLPQIGLSVLMGAIVYSVVIFNLSSLLTFLIQVSLGIVVYWIGAKIFRIESYQYIVCMLKKVRK